MDIYTLTSNNQKYISKLDVYIYCFFPPLQSKNTSLNSTFKKGLK